MLSKVISVQLPGDLFRRASYTTPDGECESWGALEKLALAASPIEANAPMCDEGWERGLQLGLRLMGIAQRHVLEDILIKPHFLTFTDATPVQPNAFLSLSLCDAAAHALQPLLRPRKYESPNSTSRHITPQPKGFCQSTPVSFKDELTKI
ncbi:hypothetical protein EG328_002826 [Venturia inaequalis]|uniref:Uncharacterized protein n=1 Tax=Venturia inaequalis TaxID=5025 RepID=A0A8H3UV94_VENIN|nr:hypothetical protein EG328_002826 [Venturia inaequalis]